MSFTLEMRKETAQLAKNQRHPFHETLLGKILAISDFRSMLKNWIFDRQDWLHVAQTCKVAYYYVYDPSFSVPLLIPRTREERLQWLIESLKTHFNYRYPITYENQPQRFPYYVLTLNNTRNMKDFDVRIYRWSGVVADIDNKPICYIWESDILNYFGFFTADYYELVGRKHGLDRQTQYVNFSPPINKRPNTKLVQALKADQAYFNYPRIEQKTKDLKIQLKNAKEKLDNALYTISQVKHLPSTKLKYEPPQKKQKTEKKEKVINLTNDGESDEY